MALNYLLDTSVVKRLANPEVRAVIEPLATFGELGRSGMCDLEVGGTTTPTSTSSRP